VARETGYLDGVQPFRGMDVYGHLPPDKVVALCTGSQGEPRAALARIAADEHPEVALSRGDRVIFSSRPIPGNEKAIGRVINGLIDQGVEVITDRTHLVHVSGHPRRAELEDMLRWVRPQIVLPVHGEPLHMAEHADLARKIGVPKVITCQDGDVVRLAPDGPKIIDEVPVGRFYKDGRILVDAQARTIPDRRRLGFAGIISVALVLNEQGQLLADPEVELTGVPETNSAGESIGDIVYDAVVDTVENLPRARKRDPDAVAESVSRAVRGTVAREWNKKPMCHVHVLTI
jgi:ribonuclease J